MDQDRRNNCAEKQCNEGGKRHKIRGFSTSHSFCDESDFCAKNNPKILDTFLVYNYNDDDPQLECRFGEGKRTPYPA